MKVADKFTLSRIVLSPIFFTIYFIPYWFGKLQVVSVYVMIPLLAFMEFTDFLDGHYARKHNQVSDFGKLFDPFGDVIVHLTIFVCFMLSGYMPSIVFILILYREFCMLFIRLMAVTKGVAIGARKGGKFKTVLYVVAGMYSLLLESCTRLGFDAMAAPLLRNIGIGLYILALAASYASFIDYLTHFKSLLRD